MLKRALEIAAEFLIRYSFDLLGAVIILIVGALLAKQTAAFLDGFFKKKRLDITLSKFLVSVARITVLGFALMLALSKFGITIAPFIAAIGAAAFGASFALQGPLSNYGAGISIILTRPFTVGDTITVQGVSGVVDEVNLAATTLLDEEGVKITIPNKHIVGEVLYNSKSNRIVETLLGISYSDDPDAAIRVIHSVLEKNDRVRKEPKPQVGIQQFGEFALVIGIRYWAPTRAYHQTLHEVNSAVYWAVKKAGIQTPFPQREIRILSEKK